MQRSFEFVVRSRPEAEISPPPIDEEQHRAVVVLLARLMVRALERKEPTDEFS